MSTRLALGAAALGLAAALIATAAAPIPAAPVPAPPAGPLDPAAYVLDSTHASVVYKARHLGISNFYGTFDAFEGELLFSDDDLANSVIALSVKADSVDSNSAQRDGHLKSPDFLNATEFPEITFVSTKFAQGRGDDTYAITGTLDFRGIQKEITVQAVKTGEGQTGRGTKIGVEVIFTIDMTDFRVPFVSESESSPIGREVQLILAGEFNKTG